MGTMVLQQRPQHEYVPPDEVDPDALDPSVYLPAWRPWLALYGARVRLGSSKAPEVVSCPRRQLPPLVPYTCGAARPQALRLGRSGTPHSDLNCLTGSDSGASGFAEAAVRTASTHHRPGRLRGTLQGTFYT